MDTCQDLHCWYALFSYGEEAWLNVESNTTSLVAAIEGVGIYLNRLPDGSGSLGSSTVSPSYYNA